MKKIYIQSIGNINVAYKQKDGTYKYVPEDVKEGQVLYYSSIEKTVKTGVQIGHSIAYKYTLYLVSTNGRLIVPMDLVDLKKSGLKENGTPDGGKDGKKGGQGEGDQGGGFGLGLGNISPWIALAIIYVILK